MRVWLAACFVWMLVQDGSVHAQPLPSWLRVQRQFLGEIEAADAAHGSAAAPAQSPHSQANQNRARRILAVGAGFALSAATTVAYVAPHRKPCWGSDEKKGSVPLKIAAGVGGVGLAGVVGGVTWLVLEARRHGYYPSRRQRAIAAGYGATAFVLSQGLLGTSFFFDQLCSS